MMRPSNARHIAAGFCGRGCGRPLATKTQCRECLVKSNASAKERAVRYVSAGLCIRGCGRPLVTGSHCRECLDRQKAVTARYVSAGLCIRGCGRPLVNKTCCSVCALIGLAATQRRNGRKGITAERVLQVWEREGGRCAFTGKALTPGVNASLEHLVPVSKGGTDAPENLVFIHIALNKAKGNLSASDFVNMCGAVWTRREHILDLVRRAEMAVSQQSNKAVGT